MRRGLFTSRIGGFSSDPYSGFNLANHVGDDANSVLRNRELLSSLIGMRPDQLFFMNQVHGNKVYVVDQGSDSKAAPEADALFTTRRDVALVVLVADCIPLLLHSKSAVAAVHVGRKGLASKVFAATLEIFAAHGVSPNEISAEIGPSICAKCYEVDEDVYREVTSIVPQSACDFRSAKDKPCLDLPKGLKAQLDAAGIKWSSEDKCTNHEEDYFSYRKSGITGRQAGVISLSNVAGHQEQPIRPIESNAHE